VAGYRLAAGEATAFCRLKQTRQAGGGEALERRRADFQ